MPSVSSRIRSDAALEPRRPHPCVCRRWVTEAAFSHPRLRDYLDAEFFRVQKVFFSSPTGRLRGGQASDGPKGMMGTPRGAPGRMTPLVRRRGAAMWRWNQGGYGPGQVRARGG